MPSGHCGVYGGGVVLTEGKVVSDDFDLSGPSTAAPPEAPPLTDISITYAAVTYIAFAFLVVGLAYQTFRLVQEIRRSPPAFEGDTLLGRLFRAGTDVVLLRSTFFADRWAWIFGACFHFGLALILLRHLRYFIDPNWVGPLWIVEEYLQPFGFYGGALLPLGAALWWGRQMLHKEGRILTHWTDHAVIGLLIAIPVVGYINTYVHTDIVQLKAFALGLVTTDYSNIPADPLLLLHLWLVAAFMFVVPFSHLLLLLPFGDMLDLEAAPGPGGDAVRKRQIRILLPTLLVVLIAPIAVTINHAVTDGMGQEVPAFASLIKEHRNADATVMIRSHPKFLFSFRSAVLHQGAVVPSDNIESCVNCHAVKDEAGQPVGFENPKHFCRACHLKVAVTIDCFECHASKPASGGQAMIILHDRYAAVAGKEETVAR